MAPVRGGEQCSAMPLPALAASTAGGRVEPVLGEGKGRRMETNAGRPC